MLTLVILSQCYRQPTRMYVLHFVFFKDPATTDIYTLSLHDALPISRFIRNRTTQRPYVWLTRRAIEVPPETQRRSEEHTSELQSRQYLVCRLLLEKKNKNMSSRSDLHVCRGPNASRADPHSALAVSQ